MQLFFIEKVTKRFALPKKESRHISKVLRLKKGDTIHITDGKGRLFNCEILDIHNNTILQVINESIKEKKHNYYLHIAIAPTKNIKRFEWFLEKSTEIGIDRITPIICVNSERRKINEERCNKILISAMKQSLKYHKPKLDQIIPFNNFIMKMRNNVSKYIAHCKQKEITTLKEIKSTKKNLIMIGPEGDFSDKEINDSIDQKYKPISLGSNRLRTETAGISATQIINFIN